MAHISIGTIGSFQASAEEWTAYTERLQLFFVANGANGIDDEADEAKRRLPWKLIRVQPFLLRMNTPTNRCGLNGSPFSNPFSNPLQSDSRPILVNTIHVRVLYKAQQADLELLVQRTLLARTNTGLA